MTRNGMNFSHLLTPLILIAVCVCVCVPSDDYKLRNK